MNPADILLTVDFDHTLTDRQGRIPPENLAAIARFIARGGAFTVNTGRSLPMLLPQLRRWGIPVNAPLLLYNGAVAYDLPRGKILFATPLEQSPLELLPALQAAFPALLVEVQGLEAHYIFRDEPLWFRFEEENQVPGRRISYDQVPRPFLKAAVYGAFADGTVGQFYRMTPREDGEIRAVEEYLARAYGARMSVVRGCPRILDIQAPGVNKGAAARRLAEGLGRRVLACVGDGTNDEAMLRAADLAYVPADAHESLLPRYETLCPCGEGAVAAAIARLMEA